MEDRLRSRGCLDIGFFGSVAGLVTTVEDLKPRSAIAKLTLPAAIDNGFFDSVAGLVTALSKDQDPEVRAMIARCTLPTAIDKGLYDRVAGLVTQMSKDQAWRVRGEIASRTLPAAISKGEFDNVAGLVIELSKDPERRLMDTTVAGFGDATSAAARSGGPGTVLMALLVLIYVGNATEAAVDESTTMADERRLMDTTMADPGDTTSAAALRSAFRTVPAFALAAALGLAARR
jgi:hypothetical protein